MDSDTDFRTLEQIRHRLLNLAGTIQKLQVQFQNSAPEQVPPWRNISVVQDSLKSHLRALQEIFRDQNKSEFLKSAHAYPTSSYPWSEENTLGLLLRKRLEPDIVTWVNSARATGVGLNADVSPSPDETAMDVDLENKAGNLRSADWAELWDWAAPAANQIAREILYEEEDEEDDDEDDEDEGDRNDKQKAVAKVDGPMVNLDDLLRFASTGREVVRATT